MKDSSSVNKGKNSLNEKSCEYVEQSLWRRIIWSVITLILATGGLLFIYLSDSAAPEAPSLQDLQSAQGLAERSLFYDKNIYPLVEVTARDNNDAVERAIQRTEETFNNYRRGFAPFADDIASMGTRFEIMSRMPLDFWDGNDRVKSYIAEKFESHLFDEEKFRHDIASILSAFYEDIEANQNRLYAQSKVVIDSNDTIDFYLLDYQTYIKNVQLRLQDFIGQRGQESVYNGLGTLAFSEIAGLAAAQLTAQLGGRFATMGSGSIIGPIGLGVGLVVAVAVDWYMTDRFKIRLIEDMEKYLNSALNILVEGDGVSPGLEESLRLFAQASAVVQDDELRRAIIGEQK